MEGLNDDQLREGWVVAWPQAEEGLAEMGGAPPPRGIPRRRDILGGKAGVGQPEMFGVGGGGAVLCEGPHVWGGADGVPGDWRRSREAEEEVLGHPPPARPLPFS